MAIEWKQVMFAADCDPDGDGWCQIRNIDVGECDCYGPTQDGLVYYVTDEGVLMGAKRTEMKTTERGRCIFCDNTDGMKVAFERFYEDATTYSGDNEINQIIEQTEGLDGPPKMVTRRFYLCMGCLTDARNALIERVENWKGK